MTLPSIILGILISTLYGALFHLLRGGGLGRLLLYLILGWVGFAAGQGLAEYWGWDFDSLGQLHIGTASVGAFFLIVLGYWLSRIEVEKTQD